MKFIRTLKPTLWKWVVSIILTIIWVIINWFLSKNIMCKLCEMPVDCKSYYSFLIVHDCSCDCITLLKVFGQYLYLIIIPLVAIYLIYSIIQYIFLRTKVTE